MSSSGEQIAVHLAQVVVDERRRDRLEMLEVNVRSHFCRQHRPPFRSSIFGITEHPPEQPVMQLMRPVTRTSIGHE